MCVVWLLRLQLNFWISFKGKSVVDLIIYCGAVVAEGPDHVGGDSPHLISLGLHLPFYNSLELIEQIFSSFLSCGTFHS
jgi:hypothetical protein